MWNPNQNPYYDLPPFKRHPIGFNVRPRLPPFPAQRPGMPRTLLMSPSPLQRVPYQSANKRTLVSMPVKNNDYNNSPFVTKIDRRTVPNLNSPVFSTSSVSPVFSSNILEGTSDSHVIPFLGDSGEPPSISTASQTNTSDNGFILSQCDTHVAAADMNSLKPTATTPSKNLSSLSSTLLYEDIPEPEMDVPPKTENFVKSQNEHIGAAVCTGMVNKTMPASTSVEDDEKPAVSTDSGDPFSFNITKVLGDAKMLNDILSVAKTIQFSEQSKSLNFPSGTGKSVAIVPPINMQSTVSSGSCSMLPSSHMSCAEPCYKTLETSDLNAPVLPQLPGPWAQASQGCKTQGFEPTEPTCRTQTALTRFGDNIAVIASPSTDVGMHGSSSNAFLDSGQQFPAVEKSLKRVFSEAMPTHVSGSPLKMLKSDPDDKSLPDCVTQTNASSLEYAPNDLNGPSSFINDAGSSTDLHCSSNMPYRDPLPEADIKSALFHQLGQYSIANDNDADIVLQVISSLAETYLKYKLRFIPTAKFQNLMTAIREGKEKETNFVLGFLKCGSGTPKESASTVSLAEDQKEKTTGNVLKDDQVTSASEQCGSCPAVATSSPVPQLQPFVPMYSNGNYWMASNLPVMRHSPRGVTPATTSYLPMQPPLPPPPIQPPLPPPVTQIQPPLPLMVPPLPPPPIPLSDVPLPPQ